MPDASTGDEFGRSFDQYIPVQDRMIRYTEAEAAKMRKSGFTGAILIGQWPDSQPRELTPRQIADKTKLESEKKRGWIRDGGSYFEKNITRYANGKIYKLVHQGKCIYVGSTIRDLHTRLSGHRNSAKAGTSPIYNFMRGVGPDTVTIELLEAFPCKSKCQLIRREMELIGINRNDELLNCVVTCT